jgi:hypothetical protein
MEKPGYLQKVIDYFKKNLKKGYTLDSLRFALEMQGYSKALIDRAAEEVIKDLAREAPILKEKPIIKHEIIDQYNRPVKIKKKNFFERLFG